ncbi:hypothetical protein AGMMS50230_04460 [Spirochaetia bacterium]|nr:hypothetical protein AGMMS50230_04460 [Spirochaetia bacterium]
MAGKTDPSIYDDRTTIGSSDELDEYGVWVKTEPQDLSASLPDIEELPDMDAGLGELPDFDDFALDSPDTGTSTEEVLTESVTEDTFTDFSPETTDDTLLDSSDETFLDSSDVEFEEIPENSELPEGPAPIPIDKDGFTEVSMNAFLDSGDIPESIDFGDLDNTVPEIPSEKVSSPAQNRSQGGADLSTQLLQKIADELSSIKNELASLKSELSAVRSEPRGESSADKGGGFFDEEDDEKIALTGDELDNILNTANFTEEAGADESLAAGGDSIVGDDSIVDGGGDDLSFDIPLSDAENLLDETSNADTPGDESSLDISFDDSDLSELDGALKVEDDLKNTVDDFSIEDDLPDFGDESLELNSLREEGAAPITSPPDDTSYLEEDPLAPADEHIDLSGAIIDEPDLSADITENPVSEPSLENISVDLDMEDPSLSGSDFGAAETAASIPETAGPDDFIFETEDTLEIPATETPLIDDSTDISLPDFGSDDISFDTGTAPQTDLTEEGPGETLTDISATDKAAGDIPSNLKQELKTVLSYMDQLLESLPEDKIEEFAKSEYFDTYKKLFEELGLV